MKLSLLSLALCGALAAVQAYAARPNVLLILVDDLKPTLGAYGDTKAITPNIDRLARGSVLFTRAYANQAVCAPSRHALFVGLRPTTLGVYDLNTNFRLGAPNAVTLFQQFHAAGYRTEAIGKIYHSKELHPLDAAAFSVPQWMANQGSYSKKPEGRPAMEFADVGDEAYADGKLAAEAVRRLSSAATKPDEPFFLTVGFHKPHLPFCAPKKYWDLHARTKFEPDGPSGPPEGAPDFAPTTWGELRNYTDIPDLGPLTLDQQRELVRGYYAATSYVDAQIGRVLAELERLKLDRNTIVVLWGDHGWHLGDHGFWAKHTNYEQAARIPLIIRAPGLAAGARSDAFVETVDFYPTLAALTGVTMPPGPEGVSQLPVLQDPTKAVRQDVQHVYQRPMGKQGRLIGRAVRTDRHRLVEWKRAGAPADTAILELYDFEADPRETRNLAADQPDVVKRLRARLAEFPEARPQIEPSATSSPKAD